MEVGAALVNYLPLSFRPPKEQEYIEFLWNAEPEAPADPGPRLQ